MTIHRLKLQSEYFDDVLTNRKPFEVRFNDRNYQVDDILILKEYSGQIPLIREIRRKVSYVLNSSDYCKDGYVILGLKPIDIEDQVFEKTDLYNEMLSSFSADFWLAQKGHHKLKELQQKIDDKNELLMKDIDLLERLDFNLRHGNVVIYEKGTNNA